ncbi:MAG: hypothetical protein ACO36I_12840 [Candidatus Latescibacterota bacterium]|jgi:hypothetical protein
MAHHHDAEWTHKYPKPPSLAELGLEDPESNTKRKSGADLTKPKKFRFQLLHDWLTSTFAPCRVADIGGAKGLLAYMLQKSGWQATVIDPHPQPLPTKYKDLSTGKRVILTEQDSVPNIPQAFQPEMAQDFDLLLGLHAHGSNLHIVNSAAQYGCHFVLLPCCVIDEPATPPHGVHWLPWLVNEAKKKTFETTYFKLNFKGQNIGFYGKSNTH